MNAAETIQAAIERLEGLQAEASNKLVMNGWLVESVGEHTCGGYSEASGWMHEPGCGFVPLTNDPVTVTLYNTIDVQRAILREYQDHLTNPLYDHDEDENFERDYWDIMRLARAILGEVSS